MAERIETEFGKGDAGTGIGSRPCLVSIFISDGGGIGFPKRGPAPWKRCESIEGGENETEYRPFRPGVRHRNVAGWSSTQNSNNNAWVQRFSDGNQNNNNKNNNNRVRCVRR